MCNGARCRCLEALPVVVEHVNFLPSRNAEGNASVAPAEKTDNKESVSPTSETGAPWPKTPEYDQNAVTKAGEASVLDKASVAAEDGQDEVGSTEKPCEVQDESAESKEAAPPSKEPPPSHTRLFSEEELEALEAKTPSTVGVELEEYDKELEERLFPLDEVELEKRVTLAASAEAKRANRDFRTSPSPTKEETRAEPGPSGPKDANDEDASIMNEVIASIVPSTRVAVTTADERRVIANIGVPRADLKRKVDLVFCVQ
ncbi:hypothetical protein PF007_g23778 [Phytophthora fragariae]|uniref:Uncharacterized protein n=1 Tax=Phytophthora fragariae TaxID=53985 RepID=A0A6A3QKV9_9STRA|nr:hypothetical protein PF009_g19598 [Phytophthora fragariae]KAE9078622.1 hypothetical protein PF007_g23778 [Phytophthora fragariae]